jgi:hypothetical protein
MSGRVVLIIADAWAGRAWNHRAAQTPAASILACLPVLDVQLHSGFTFKCISDGGGRCNGGRHLLVFPGRHAHLPQFIAMRSPDQQALAMLASLYAFQSLISGDAAGPGRAQARDIHAQRAVE